MRRRCSSGRVRQAWRPARGGRPGAEVEAREAPFELLETSDFLDSTIARVYLTADPIRRRLAVPDPVLDFPILSELRAEGVTDYLATPDLKPAGVCQRVAGALPQVSH
jgi:hypothetical protein